MSNQRQRPAVGIGVFVMCGDRFVMLKRRGSHGAGMWGLVGGAVEWGETITEAAVRETREEVGLDIDPSSVRIGPVINDIDRAAGVHYVGIYVSARISSGHDPRLMEPDKASEVGWFTLESLPEPLFPPARAFLAFNAGLPFGQRDLPVPHLAPEAH